MNMNGLWNEKITDFVGGKENFKVSVKERWGRLGIDFGKEWTPVNIFAGVLLNNRDHKISHFDNCPQFVIMVDCNLTERDKTVNSDKYKHLKNIAIPDGYKYETKPGNLWRIAVLSKPLTEIIDKAGSNYDEQKRCIQDEILKGINIILKK